MKRKDRLKHETVSVCNVTVKIYRRQRRRTTGKSRTIYELADYTTGIRRLRGFSDHGDARKEAEKIARSISAGEATVATMRNPEAASYGRAVELLRPTRTPIEIAAGAYANAFEILGGDYIVEAAKFYARHRVDQIERRPVADVVSEMISLKETQGKAARYLDDLRARLNRFAEAFAVDISTVTTADLQRWIDGLKVAPQTSKDFRTVLHTLFSFAESRGYIFKGGNPVAGTEKISSNGGTIQIFTLGEIIALLNAAPKEFVPVIAIGGFAGLRTAEIQRIECRDVDLSGGFIHVGSDKAKTRSRRLVPILPNLAQWLAPYAKQTGKVWKGTTTDLRDIRAATVETSGVTWKDNGLRHSFCSYRLADIQNAVQVALEAGNSPAMVFKHYRELVKPSEAKAWFAIVPKAPANVVAVNLGAV